MATVSKSTDFKSQKLIQAAKYNLTPQDMWNAIHDTGSFGIEGYEVPRQYYDYHQVKWYEERKKILEGHKSKWPPQNWPTDKETGKQIPPKRINFIDEQIKWAQSFNDPKRSEELKASLESRGTFKVPEPKQQMNMRDKFLAWEKEHKEKMASIAKIPEWKQNSVETAQKNIEEARAKQKTQWEKDKERYTKDKPLWPRCERVGILSDAEYVGEQIPFYKTSPKEKEKNPKYLFYPDSEKTSKFKNLPKWAFQSKSPTKLPTENMKAKQELYNQKIDNLKSAKNLTDKDLNIDVMRSYDAIRNRGRYPITIHKPYDYSNTEQYKLNKEQHPDFTPGPSHYWRMKDMDTNSVPKELQEEKEINGKMTKIYYMNRKRTDFREYKPMRKSVF